MFVQALPIGVDDFEKLVTEGYCFVDRNAAELRQWNGISVIGMEAVAELNHKDDDIAIVTLQSGMAHDEIALELFQNGIANIMFSPVRTGFSGA